MSPTTCPVSLRIRRRGGGESRRSLAHPWLGAWDVEAAATKAEPLAAIQQTREVHQVFATYGMEPHESTPTFISSWADLKDKRLQAPLWTALLEEEPILATLAEFCRAKREPGANLEATKAAT